MIRELRRYASLIHDEGTRKICGKQDVAEAIYWTFGIITAMNSKSTTTLLMHIAFIIFSKVEHCSLAGAVCARVFQWILVRPRCPFTIVQ